MHNEEEKYKILLVDDEEDNLMLLYRTLRGKYELTKTTNPLEAVELLKNNFYHLVISDHKMPEMDGVELLQFVNSHYPDTVKILLTAYSDASILISAMFYKEALNYLLHRQLIKFYIFYFLQSFSLIIGNFIMNFVPLFFSE